MSEDAPLMTPEELESARRLGQRKEPSQDDPGLYGPPCQPTEMGRWTRHPYAHVCPTCGQPRRRQYPLGWRPAEWRHQ